MLFNGSIYRVYAFSFGLGRLTGTLSLHFYASTLKILGAIVALVCDPVIFVMPSKLPAVRDDFTRYRRCKRFYIAVDSWGIGCSADMLRF